MFGFPFIPAALLATCPYSGLDGQTAVPIPRIAEADIVIDASLTEPVWSQAAVLCGFSEYSPVDGRPADDSTEVLVWYSPHAIYFGIRAFERHGAVHAAHANRDRIANDDWVEILLDTFNDRRQALVFGVNPLGVQADGTLIETQAGSKDTVDFSADFVYQSQGRLTPTGFEVEIRIPFKSIRYQSQSGQQWGLNVVRQVQHSGHRATWTAARLTAASFLAQSGTLTGLSDLRRGLVLDVNPEFTAKVDGAPDSTGRWDYGSIDPDIGGNLRWGVTNNLTLTGTARPDFSQVEADAGQLVNDPREALYFPEKRPFFLEGLEQFNTPNSLVYTRRLVQPVAAIKLTGKVSGFGVGLLSGLDDRAYSASRTDNPVYNILRVRRDLSGQSIVGIVYTDKIDGPDYNRVAGGNARIVFGTHTLAFQGVESFTRTGAVTRNAPLWYAALDRTGRHFGYTYSINAIAPDFVAASGFIPRPGLASAVIDHRVTRYGRPGAALESWTGDILLRGRWAYTHLMSGKVPDDQFLHFTSTWQVRGWNVSAAFYLESFGFDSAYYSTYRLQHTAGGVTQTVPFIGVPRITNYDFFATVETPQFRRFNASFLVLPAVQDENFFEWSPAWIIFVQAGLDWRPSDRMRVNLTYLHQQFWRKTDGSTVGRDLVPRVKVEYQAGRSLFFRVVGQYAAHWQDSLRDDSRTDDPILIFDPDSGAYVRAVAKSNNDLRLDWLLSYTPSPGTVVYAGYGSSLAEPEAFRFQGIHRSRDGFFVKVSYLLRL